MAKLKTSTRKPKERATQQVKKGKLSAGAAAKIRAKADRVLGDCS